jgi:23S rRNA (uracil1939-C5)-methyltransferase
VNEGDRRFVSQQLKSALRATSLQLTIEKLVYGGDGLARLPADEYGQGKAVFVPFVLEGEAVEVSLTEEKRGFARARLESVLQPSDCRIAPPCPYFQQCGGCHYQHTSYEHQLEIKTAILKENLRRLAKLELTTELQVHPSPAWNYRNRTRLKVQTSPEFALGYYKFNSHELLPIKACPISSPLINRAIDVIWDLGRKGRIAPKTGEIELFADATDRKSLVELYCSPEAEGPRIQKMAEELKQSIPEILGVASFKISSHREEPEQIAVTGGGELSYETKHGKYRVSARAFFQVNRHLIDDLVNLVSADMRGTLAVDLYAGVGLFASVLSREFAQVIAVESSPISHADLRYNSSANVKAVRAMTQQYLVNVSGKLRPDLVVVDPPRSGLGESVVHSLVTMGAPRMIYLSCDPATLSRDLKPLLGAGYRVEQAHLVDLFPQTYHLESVFHLVR